MIINHVEKCLEDQGYTVSISSGCFDILAKKDESLALKVLYNIDSFTQTEAGDLKTISHLLNTTPLLVGERANRYGLSEDVIYKRHGVSTMSPRTFECFVNGAVPEIKSRRGGFTVRISRERFDSYLRESGFSMSDFSKNTGISLKTLYKCAHGGSIDIETREEIERVMGVNINKTVDLSTDFDLPSRKPKSVFKQNLSLHLDRMGLLHSFLSRSPFNLVIKEENAMVSVASESKKRLETHVDIMHNLERHFDLNPVFITGRTNVKEMSGIPTFTFDEVRGMENRKEFLMCMQERKY